MGVSSLFNEIKPPPIIQYNTIQYCSEILKRERQNESARTTEIACLASASSFAKLTILFFFFAGKFFVRSPEARAWTQPEALEGEKEKKKPPDTQAEEALPTLQKSGEKFLLFSADEEQACCSRKEKEMRGI